jgi:hypothetical protein
MRFKLYDLAARFRSALEQCPGEGLSAYLEKRLARFPDQCCEIASLLLARFFRDQGFTQVACVQGVRDGTSHEWLEVDGFVVDITADQFADVDDPVIVSEVRELPWHSMFQVQRREPAFPRKAVRTEYDQAYAVLQRRLSLISPTDNPVSREV